MTAESSEPVPRPTRPDPSNRIRAALAAWRALLQSTVAVVLLVVIYLGICTTLLIAFRWIDPPFTAVQAQRRLEAVLHGAQYTREYQPRSMEEVSSDLPRAVVAAEDNRFYEHVGFDWKAIETALEEGRGRGASTISQQLSKNLFLSTRRSYLRKGLEVPLTMMVEILLSKDRILELYVNIAEWGNGVFGAEAAARYHFGISADRLGRRQSAGLASCLPDPRHRRPRLDGRYTNIILRRMDQMGY